MPLDAGSSGTSDNFFADACFCRRQIYRPLPYVGCDVFRQGFPQESLAINARSWDHKCGAQNTVPYVLWLSSWRWKLLGHGIRALWPNETELSHRSGKRGCAQTENTLI